ncbi:unnamed protein product, partial [marine sediment metagenome]
MLEKVVFKFSFKDKVFISFVGLSINTLTSKLYLNLFNLEPGKVDIILLDDAKGIKAGDEVRRTNQVMDVPVGESLLGRVIDPVSRPLDNL